MIRRLLVANRGEITRRVFRTCREMGIETVAVHSDPDANDPFVLEADIAMRLPGSSPAATYLDIGSVLRAAADAGADAIHPGYGFLAESADFAQQVVDAGLTWIGPPPAAIEIMGSKLASKQLVTSLGIPTLPGKDLTGSDEVETARAADEIGYPVLVKASAGGGGKGMRIVDDPGGLTEAISGARREATAAFGDGTLFLEKYLVAPRHIEFQVFGDHEGSLLSLFERECSIQRRHQKIIEEAPSPAIDPDLRAEMGAAAIRAAAAVGYVGAGTVEFLFQDDEYFFLEMNTRLQVEHGVTEMVTGLDLVRLQIEVASGQPLAIDPKIVGHSIEARLYAEDPGRDFLPVTGEIHRFDFSQSPGLRVDSGVEAGSVVSAFYDPMLAKVIAHAPTRVEAAETLALALRSSAIHGSTTNLALLVRILEHPRFLSGDIDTHFLEGAELADLARPLADAATERIAAVATALSDQAAERERARVLGTLPSGWRNNPGGPQARTYRGDHCTHSIRYHATDRFVVEDAAGLDVTVCTPGEVELTVDNTMYRFDVARYGDLRFLDSDTQTIRLVAEPRFPLTGSHEPEGSISAPMPGKVIRVGVRVGDLVDAGQLLVVMEAMKMEHTLRSPSGGRVVQVDCGPGDQVEAGAVLVVVEAV